MDIWIREDTKRLARRGMTRSQRIPTIQRFFTMQLRRSLIVTAEIAIQLLLKAQSLDGFNPKWARALGHMYELDRRGGWDDDDVELAEKALTQFERAYELTDGPAREVFLADLAQNAFVAGQYDKAREYAEAALHDNSGGWNQGNRTHWGHLTLGRIAFAEGNIEEAKHRLIAAAMIQGSPQLNSFGPDMTLAEELLEAGEKDVVLKYFERSRILGVGQRRSGRLDSIGQIRQEARLQQKPEILTPSQDVVRSADPCRTISPISYCKSSPALRAATTADTTTMAS